MGFNIYSVKSLERNPAWHTVWFSFRVRLTSEVLAAPRCKPAQADRKTTGRPSTCEIGSSNQDLAPPPPPPLIRPTPSARSGGDAASKLRQWSEEQHGGNLWLECVDADYWRQRPTEGGRKGGKHNSQAVNVKCGAVDCREIRAAASQPLGR